MFDETASLNFFIIYCFAGLVEKSVLILAIIIIILQQKDVRKTIIIIEK